MFSFFRRSKSKDAGVVADKDKEKTGKGKENSKTPTPPPLKRSNDRPRPTEMCVESSGTGAVSTREVSHSTERRSATNRDAEGKPSRDGQSDSYERDVTSDAASTTIVTKQSTPDNREVSDDRSFRRREKDCAFIEPDSQEPNSELKAALRVEFFQKNIPLQPFSFVKSRDYSLLNGSCKTNSLKTDSTAIESTNKLSLTNASEYNTDLTPSVSSVGELQGAISEASLPEYNGNEEHYASNCVLASSGQDAGFKKDASGPNSFAIQNGPTTDVAEVDGVFKTAPNTPVFSRCSNKNTERSLQEQLFSGLSNCLTGMESGCVSEVQVSANSISSAMNDVDFEDGDLKEVAVLSEEPNCSPAPDNCLLEIKPDLVEVSNLEQRLKMQVSDEERDANCCEKKGAPSVADLELNLVSKPPQPELENVHKENTNTAKVSNDDEPGGAVFANEVEPSLGSDTTERQENTRHLDSTDPAEHCPLLTNGTVSEDDLPGAHVETNIGSDKIEEVDTLHPENTSPFEDYAQRIPLSVCDEAQNESSEECTDESSASDDYDDEENEEDTMPKVLSQNSNTRGDGSSLCETNNELYASIPGPLYDIEEEGSEDEETDDDIEDLEEPQFGRNLVSQESRFEEKVAELTSQLALRETESNCLLSQVEELQRDVQVKSSGMERLQAELMAAHRESECVRRRLRRLEDDLDVFRQKNAELADEILKRTGGLQSQDYDRMVKLDERVEELSSRVKELEEHLEVVKEERNKLQTEAAAMAEERDQERQIIQEALDEAISEKRAIQVKFEKDFEHLRTVNTDREHQLLDDFEWKLREVEQACKRRLEEKETNISQRVKDLESQLKHAEEQLAQVEHLKTVETEMKQLRLLSLDQQRSLRGTTRQLEQLQVNEKVLMEEVQRLRILIDREKTHLTTVQGIHNREIAEKDKKIQYKLEQQKSEINAEWSEKLRRECDSAKAELYKLNNEEKRKALQAAKQQLEKEVRLCKEASENRLQECIKEVEWLKQQLTEKEESFHREMEKAQTKSDQDIFELRRKLDKIDMLYQEKIEKMQVAHDREMERVTEECERRVQQAEQSLQLQASTTRTTLELVKEQLQREAQQLIQALNDRHNALLQEQWEQLVQEREETVSHLEEAHIANTEKLRTELDTLYKSNAARESEIVELVSKLRQELSGKKSMIWELENKVEVLQGGLDLLNENVSKHSEEVVQVQNEAEETLKLRQEELEAEFKQRLEQMASKHKLEVNKWQANSEELQLKVTALSRQVEESKGKSDSRTLAELRRALSEKEQQVANLRKEKHIYQPEAMNRDSVQAKQRRKGGKGGGGQKGNKGAVRPQVSEVTAASSPSASSKSLIQSKRS